ncbi:MAG: hypothetical protein KGQ52_13805 [Alphaproteobacteria bacterium]|nr:hypothetical protein [Alphaproteobacteria bacterium]
MMKAWRDPAGTIHLQPSADGLPPGSIEVAPPPPGPPRFTPEKLWQLLTVPEHVAARQSGDATVAVAFDRINARQAPLALDDPYFIALVARLVQPLAVITLERATAILAGQFPEGGS